MQLQPQIDVEIEDPERERQLAEERLQAFGHTMAQQRDEWIRARASSGVDKRWVEDEDQYNAKDNVNKAASQMMTSVEQGFPVTTHGATPHRSTVYIGLTRQKTNAAEARMSDILLPTDDRNWGIQPTPEPSLLAISRDARMAGDKETGRPMVDPDSGQPLRMKDIARAAMKVARDKAKAMQTEIEDQLIECDYNSEVRKVLHNAGVLGTGVLKGPVVTNRIRRSWQPYKDMDGNQVHQIVIMEEISPASFNVDPRNVWPDPGCGDNVHKGKGIYEREQMTSRQIRDLAKQPGFMKNQLRKVLEEGPKRSATFQEMRGDDLRDTSRDVYEMWTYWGEVNHEDMDSAGVFVGEKDELRSVSACVVMVNSTVVKAYLNPLGGGDLPYDFYVWEKVAGSVWGYGVPYLMRAQQRVLNAAWRQMMDNAGVSSGPQIIIKAGAVQPADKQWQLSSRKIWFATDDVDDVRKAFTAVEFSSYQGELANIIKMAMELADQETGVPTIMQGEKGAAPDTVGGMQMLMNSANVVLRRLVKQFDDMVTKPHIRRYYDYNMMYNDDEEIKGDFSIDARGSSALMVRDVQNQAFMNLLAAGANPIYGQYLDTQKLFEKALQAQHIDPTEVLKSEEELEKIKEQAASGEGDMPDPRVAAAQIRAETDIAKVQAQNQGDMAELETRKAIAQLSSEMRMQEMGLTREIEMLKMANTQNLTLEQIKAKLADTAMRERGKKELYAAEQNLKMAVGSGI